MNQKPDGNEHSKKMWDFYNNPMKLMNDDETQNYSTDSSAIAFERATGKTPPPYKVENVDGYWDAYSFGRKVTEPIPVNGLIGAAAYLSKLVTDSGQKVFSHGVGFAGSICIAETVSADGAQWDVLYLDMGYQYKSKRAPFGYTLLPEITEFRAMAYSTPDFPVGSYYHDLRMYNEVYDIPVDPAAQNLGAFKRPEEQKAKRKEARALPKFHEIAANLLDDNDDYMSDFIRKELKRAKKMPKEKAADFLIELLDTIYNDPLDDEESSELAFSSTDELMNALDLMDIEAQKYEEEEEELEDEDEDEEDEEEDEDDEDDDE